MHRAALEGVVEILAVRRGAVDERCTGSAERAPVADRRAPPVVIPPGERGLDVVLVASGEAEPDHVDGRFLALAAHRLWQARHRGDAVDELLCNGNVGKLGVHARD